MNTRREFLQTLAYSGLGVTMLPIAMGAGGITNIAENVIYLYMDGGMSHLDTFDPKTNQEVRGKFGILETGIPNFTLSEHLKGIGKLANRAALVRGMRVTTGDHAGAQYYARTSYKKIGTITHPSMGAWVAMHKQDPKAVLPANVVINGPATHPGSGWLPKRYSPLPILDPTKGLENTNLNDQVTFSKKVEILNMLNKAQNKLATDGVKGYADFYDQTVKLLKSKDLEAFDLTKEPKEIRDQYGDNKFGQGCLLARRLIQQAGVRFVEVSHGGWDTHVNNFDQLETKLPIIDQAVAALVGDLERCGLMKNTLIVVATEFGRTPDINVSDGRDHHPGAFSNLLIGAGIRGGSVWGKTDERGDKVVEGETSTADFNATIAAAAGLPIAQEFKTPEGRPMFIASKEGKPIKSILAV
jgi:uncharacterized protein (DUF1501 family)